MMKLFSTQHGANAYGKKAMRTSALAFFLLGLFAQAALSQTNWVDGTAFGTNYATLSTSPAISSLVDGPGNLQIEFPGTSSITLSNRIDGHISVNNASSELTIEASGSTVSNWQETVLSVVGVTDFSLSGGNFIGLAGTNVTASPPIPGGETQASNSDTASQGGYLSGVQHAYITNAHFSGATYSPDPTEILGTIGLATDDTTLIITGTNSLFSGGNAGSIYNSTNDVTSRGGHALTAFNSTVIVSNGTFSGGHTGSATAGSDFDASTFGGSGLYATNSTLQIYGGTFTGGNAGAASAEGSGSAITQAGTALYTINSDVLVEDGTFTGGKLGRYDYYGFVSRVDAGRSQSIELNGGTFNLIGFTGSGSQHLTAGTHLKVDEMVQDGGGTLNIENLNNAALQNVSIYNGSMSFFNDFTLSDSGEFNLLSDSANVTFPNLQIAQNATFYVGEGQVTANALELKDGGILWFSIEQTNTLGSVTADSASFDANSTIRLTGTPSVEEGTNTLKLITATDVIAVDGSTSITNPATFTDYVNVESYTSGRTSLSGILVNNGLEFEFVTLDLAGYWDAEGQMRELANEIEDIGNQTMLDLIDSYNDPALSSRLVEQTYFSTMNTFQTALNGLQAAVGQSASRRTEFRAQSTLAPNGANGPQRNSVMRGWGKYYGQYFTHDDDGLNSSYDTTLNGGVIGIEQSFGNLLIGLSGGGGKYITEYDHSDAKEDITATHGGIYGTYAAERLYIDVGAAYGHNDVKTTTAEPFTLRGDFDADMVSTYLGAGYDFIDTKGGTIFTPEASIQYTTYDQDSYTEKGTAAIPRHIESFDAESFRSSIGLNLSMLNSAAFETLAFRMDARVHWMHEFNSDPGSMDFSLQGGSNGYKLDYPELDEDIFRIGVGFSFFNTARLKPKNVMLRVDFDELFGSDFNSHNLAAKVIYAF